MGEIDMNKTYSVKSVVMLGLKFVKEHGFVSVSDARAKEIFSTSHYVKHALLDDPLDRLPNWKSSKEVDEVIEYVQTYNSSSNNPTAGDYYEKLIEVYHKLEVTYKEVAMVVSALAFFNNPKLPSSDYNDMIANSKYIGELKERDNFFVKLLKEMPKQDYWIYKFITRDGSLGYFFKNDKLDVVQGNCFLFKGTPIEHAEDRYDKVPCTKFNRIAHVEDYGNKIGD